MAEFGIATGAIQVASSGLGLAQTLYKYIDSVRKAERQFKPIADHVQLTASVLQNVGKLMQEKEIRDLCTAELMKTMIDALDGCKKAFGELEEFIKTFLKLDKAGKIIISTTGKLTWSFKKDELDLLQASLEHFKSSLDLILGVLNLASSAKTARDHAELRDMKLDVQRLIQAEKEAKEKETEKRAKKCDKSLHPVIRKPTETLDRSVTLDSSSTTIATESLARSLPNDETTEASLTPTQSSTRSFPSEEGSGAAFTRFIERGLAVQKVPVAAFALTGITMPNAPGAKDRRLESASHTDPSSSSSETEDESSSSDDDLALHLEKCAEAVSALASAIEQASKAWQHNREYKKRCFRTHYKNVRKAMSALTEWEASSELPPKTSREAAPAKIAVNFPCWCRATYSWEGETIKDLSFVEGDFIEALNIGDGLWWMGRLRRDPKAVGLFPSNFVNVLDEPIQPAVDNRITSYSADGRPKRPSPLTASSFGKPFQNYGRLAERYNLPKMKQSQGTIAGIRRIGAADIVRHHREAEGDETDGRLKSDAYGAAVESTEVDGISRALDALKKARKDHEEKPKGFEAAKAEAEKMQEQKRINEADVKLASPSDMSIPFVGQTYQRVRPVEDLAERDARKLSGRAYEEESMNKEEALKRYTQTLFDAAFNGAGELDLEQYPDPPYELNLTLDEMPPMSTPPQTATTDTGTKRESPIDPYMGDGPVVTDLPLRDATDTGKRVSLIDLDLAINLDPEDIKGPDSSSFEMARPFPSGDKRSSDNWVIEENSFKRQTMDWKFPAVEPDTMHSPLTGSTDINEAAPTRLASAEIRSPLPALSTALSHNSASLDGKPLNSVKPASLPEYAHGRHSDESRRIVRAQAAGASAAQGHGEEKSDRNSLQPSYPPANKETRRYDPAAHTDYMVLPPMPPDNQPSNSATYIPGEESFGPGVAIPPLESTSSPSHEERYEQPQRESDPKGNSVYSPNMLGSPQDGDWPLEAVQIWLASHVFSKEWQQAFRHLNVYGTLFLDIGRTGGQRNIAFMPQTLLPQVARECIASGAIWDQAKEREEGRRLRRLVRGIVNSAGAATPAIPTLTTILPPAHESTELASAGTEEPILRSPVLAPRSGLMPSRGIRTREDSPGRSILPTAYGAEESGVSGFIEKRRRSRSPPSPQAPSPGGTLFGVPEDALDPLEDQGQSSAIHDEAQDPTMNSPLVLLPFSTDAGLELPQGAAREDAPLLNSQSPTGVHYAYQPNPPEYNIDHAPPSKGMSIGGPAFGLPKQDIQATFKCNLCHERFTKAYVLRSHMRTHAEDRPWVCTVCGKAFSRQQERKRHEALHSGEEEAPIDEVDALLRKWTNVDLGESVPGSERRANDNLSYY